MFHILWHGELNCVLAVISFQINTYICFGFPVHRDCVFLAECLEKIFCVHLWRILNKKVIHHQVENCVLVVMFPKARITLHRSATVGRHMLLELLVGNDAGLF